MMEDGKENSRNQRGKLQAVLLKATADFLQQEDGMRWKDILAGYNAALDALQIVKIQYTPHPSYDLLNDGQ